jgi:carbohydrate-selective porin OprB
LGTAHAVDTLARAPDQLPTIVSAHRIELTAGKLAASDLFDANRYANSTRTQFMNWGLFQNTAWDYAADTRGYTNGVALAWIAPAWALRAGSFQMPTEANGNHFDPSLRRARGDQVELALTPTWRALGTRAPTVRLLAYVNHARMGDYAEALAAARALGTAPDIVADDRPGRRKTGWGVNVEQPLGDDGDTGAFLRAGANDGRTESFVFTEVERHVSAGVQVSGRRWGRASDVVAVAGVRHALSALHRAYLEAGGSGFLLGDGRLRYGPEEIGEAYYRAQAGSYVQVSPDVQAIAHPGYNRDRGPAVVGGVRVNVRY